MRDKIAGGATSFIFTVVVPLVVAGMIPHIDPSIGWPIVGISVIVGIGFAVWGFSPHHLRDWRAKLGPVALMVIGLATYSGGALWYYFAHSQPAQVTGQVASSASTPPPVAAAKPDIVPQPEPPKRLRREPKKKTVAAPAILPKEPVWPTDREYVPLRAEQFMEIFRGKTQEERQALVAVYKGDWIKIEGTIQSINGPDTRGQLRVYVSETKPNSIFGTLVSMTFDPSWTKKIAPLQKDTILRAIGRINVDTAFMGTLMLDHSEIISTKLN